MYIAIVTADNWHIATGQHYGDLITLPSTGKQFENGMDAINTAFEEVSNIYKGIKVYSKKGLQDVYHNELDYHGRQFDIYRIAIL